MTILIVESEFLPQDTWVGAAVARPAKALHRQNIEVMQSTSLDNGYAVIAANEAIDCLKFSYQMEEKDKYQCVRQLLDKLHEHQQNVSVFLLGEREKASALIDQLLMELIPIVGIAILGWFWF